LQVGVGLEVGIPAYILASLPESFDWSPPRPPGPPKRVRWTDVEMQALFVPLLTSPRLFIEKYLF
jgi:hypothetical protein